MMKTAPTAVIAAIVLIGSLLAPAEPTYSDGDGSSETPFQIADVNDFLNLTQTPAHWDKHFILTANLDLIDHPFIQAPIDHFTGSFDGQEHTIFNLTVTGSRRCGLFGSVDGTSSKSAVIKNIALQNCNIHSDAAYNGCLIGWARWYVTVENCHVKQSQITSPFDLIGGLIGLAGSTMTGNPDIMVSMCSVTNSNISGGSGVGGLIGCAFRPVTIQNCFVNSNVQGINRVGGLIGELNSSQIINCYALGMVQGTENIGGLIGYNNQGKVIRCYSAGKPVGTSSVGGLSGSIVTDSGFEDTGNFWDTEMSEIETSAMGIGKTTAEMKTLSTFADAGWDFGQTWAICEGTNYPRLQWQILETDWVCPDGVDGADFAHLATWWLADDCALHNDCDGADLNQSGDVGLYELLIVAEHWLK